MSADNNDNEPVQVATPRNADTLYNFGPASTRDSIVYTSERPGGDTEGASISNSKVIEWISFMKQHDIKQVMVLLDDHELEVYEEPGLLALYEQHGLQVHRNPMAVKGSVTNAERILKQAEFRKEKIVCHCTHGMGRSGRIAAGWLSLKYQLSPKEATKEALDMARQNGQERMGDVSSLTKWLENK